MIIASLFDINRTTKVFCFHESVRRMDFVVFLWVPVIPHEASASSNQRGPGYEEETSTCISRMVI